MHVWLLELAALLFVGVPAAVIAAALLYGQRRWRGTTRTAIARMRTKLSPSRPVRYDQAEIESLPDPASRYFRSVLRNGQPVIAGVRVEQEGEMRTGTTDDSWRPMVAVQAFRPLHPGFVWDARIRMARGLAVHVRDSFIGGAGSMRAEFLGLVPVLEARDTPEMAAGALQRYLAEAVWFPTALLPSQGVVWTAIDDRSARATLSAGATSVSLDFRFNAEGEVASIFTKSRYRKVKNGFEPTPWAVRCSNYAERDGMRIPLEAEAEWRIDGAPQPYWRGRLTTIACEYAE